MDDIVNMWTVPRNGKGPAPGLVRAITVFTTDDIQEFETEPEKEKVLQGQSINNLRLQSRIDLNDN